MDKARKHEQSGRLSLRYPRALMAALAGTLLLSGCATNDPPEAEGEFIGIVHHTGEKSLHVVPTRVISASTDRTEGLLELGQRADEGVQVFTVFDTGWDGAQSAVDEFTDLNGEEANIRETDAGSCIQVMVGYEDDSLIAREGQVLPIEDCVQ